MKKTNTSYSQLLRATSILASSQLVTILIRFARTKAIALLLGVNGIALIGLFQSVVDMISSFSSLGLTPGVVKGVSLATKEKDRTKAEKIIQIFRHWFSATAILGVVVCSSSALLISRLLVGNTSYVIPILLLSGCVFFTILTGGRQAILQGMRKITHLAISNILGALLGLIAVVAIYYYFGEEGIVPALIINSILVYICVHYFYRRVDIRKQKVGCKEIFATGYKALELGVFVTLGACVSALSMFIVRLIIKYYDVEELSLVGFFESAWIITNVFAGFIISSAGTDYFTRLCTISSHPAKTKKLANEQTYLVMLISTPPIIGLILFADVVLRIQFSEDFLQASTMLRWQMLGVFLKLLATPIASILLAKNKGWLYLVSEIVFFVSYLVGCHLLIPIYGLVGAGCSYLIAYALYLAVVFAMGNVMSQFMWNTKTLVLVFINTILVGSAFALSYYLPHYQSFLGLLLFALSILYSLYCLLQVVSPKQIKNWFVGEGK